MIGRGPTIITRCSTISNIIINSRLIPTDTGTVSTRFTEEEVWTEDKRPCKRKAILA